MRRNVCSVCARELSVLEDRITTRVRNGVEHVYCTEYVERGECLKRGEDDKREE